MPKTPQTYSEMLEQRAQEQFDKMLAESRSGKIAGGYSALGKILDEIATEFWRKEKTK